MKENRDEDERLLNYSVERQENPHFTDEKYSMRNPKP